MTEQRSSERPRRRTWRDPAMMYVSGALFVGQIVLCFPFYSRAGLDALLYVGWVTVAVSFLVFGGMARTAFRRKGGAADQRNWLNTRVVVDSGIYAVIRHPMYVSFTMYVIALMLISQHWLSPILGVPVIAYLYSAMLAEERHNIEKFGDDYVRYIRRVPRMNVVSGVVRLLRARTTAWQATPGSGGNADDH